MKKGSPVFYTMPVVVAMVTGSPPWYEYLRASHRIVETRTARETKKRTIEVLMGSVVEVAYNRHPLMMTLAQLPLQNVSFRLAEVWFGV